MNLLRKHLIKKRTKDVVTQTEVDGVVFTDSSASNLLNGPKMLKNGPQTDPFSNQKTDLKQTRKDQKTDPSTNLCGFLGLYHLNA